MKHIYITLSFVGCFLLMACGNDWLDEMAPSTQVESSKSMTIPTDAQYALNGVYTLMRNYEYYGARMTYYGDVKGDDMQSNGDSKRVAKYYLFTFGREDAPSSFWT
ncbi:MAG: RagB/SusD family nutrient uptake outer membrane protein, partial [Mediterranea sp.]|nr:RagB/SusD family nutrient uptake outer membrane protein [Mediterranea sp.]